MMGVFVQRAYGKEGSRVHMFNDHVGSQSNEGNDDVDAWYVAENVQFGLSVGT